MEACITFIAQCFLKAIDSHYYFCCQPPFPSRSLLTFDWLLFFSLSPTQPAKKKSKTIKAKASKHDPPPAPEAPPGARVVDASSRGVGKSGKELKAPANRKSPNGSAKDFPEEVARGNDGQWYVSCQDVKGRWFWKKADDDELAQVGF